MGSVIKITGLGPVDYIQTAFVEVGREDLAQRFVDECDEPYILFVDSDQVFEREDAEKLIDAMEWYPKIGVCAGLTVFRDGTYKPVVQWWENEHPLPGKKLARRVVKLMKEGAINEVDYVGTGFTIIRREVFKDLERPYFRVYHDNKKNFWGEDVHFIQSVRDTGWKTAVHFGTNIGHLGVVNYEPKELLNLYEQGYYDEE
jgi:GT2 family glycosyltransferase